MPRQLILIRHSVPDIDPTVPARQWSLSAEGRRRCEPLAASLPGCGLRRIVASVEPKAWETARILAARLGLPLDEDLDLREHVRDEVGFIDPGSFRDAMQRFFAQPAARVFGSETADEAHARFAAAIRRRCAEVPEGNLAAVSHGTVISLFAARAQGLDPFAFWEQLGLPALTIMEWPLA